MPYHVVYSKPRQETRAVENLHRQGYRTFLPLCRKPRDLSVRPLFPRYVFVFVSETEPWRSIQSTWGVSSLLRNSEHTLLQIADSIIEGIKERMNRDGGAVILEDNLPKPKDLKPGQKIRVISGPHVGLEGLFVGRERDRIIALLNLFGRQVRATVKESQVA